MNSQAEQINTSMKETVLSIKDLSVSFNTQNGMVDIIKDISFDIFSGENMAIVGESGSGKSVTALSILRLHDEANTVYADNSCITFEDKNLLLSLIHISEPTRPPSTSRMPSSA